MAYFIEVVQPQFDYAIEELDPETLYYTLNFEELESSSDEDEDFFEDFFEDQLRTSPRF